MTEARIRLREEVAAYNSRTAEIQFRAKDWGITEKVSITQLQKDAIIITQNEYTISEKGGNLKIEVTGIEMLCPPYLRAPQQEGLLPHDVDFFNFSLTIFKKTW